MSHENAAALPHPMVGPFLARGWDANAETRWSALSAPAAATAARFRLGDVADDGALCLEQRRRALARMADEVFDVAIIGGGVVGCGAALDAATRGLRVALIEARDLASGTSSRSSKLIHGGLRYLEHLEFGLVSEALHERAGMLDRLAPHLVRPLPFLLLLSRRAWERPYVGAGLLLYDTMGTTLGRARGVPGQRHYTKRATLRRFPGLREDAFTGSIQYFDAQVDDARYTLFLARTAAAHGTQIASRAQAVSLLREEGGVVGVGVVDLEAPRRPLIECARGGRSTRRAFGPTRSRRSPEHTINSDCSDRRACTSWCRAIASTARRR